MSKFWSKIKYETKKTTKIKIFLKKKKSFFKKSASTQENKNFKMQSFFLVIGYYSFILIQCEEQKDEG